MQRPVNPAEVRAAPTVFGNCASSSGDGLDKDGATQGHYVQVLYTPNINGLGLPVSYIVSFIAAESNAIPEFISHGKSRTRTSTIEWGDNRGILVCRALEHPEL